MYSVSHSEETDVERLNRRVRKNCYWPEAMKVLKKRNLQLFHPAWGPAGGVHVMIFFDDRSGQEVVKGFEIPASGAFRELRYFTEHFTHQLDSYMGLNKMTVPHRQFEKPDPHSLKDLGRLLTVVNPEPQVPLEIRHREAAERLFERPPVPAPVEDFLPEPIMGNDPVLADEPANPSEPEYEDIPNEDIQEVENQMAEKKLPVATGPKFTVLVSGTIRKLATIISTMENSVETSDDFDYEIPFTVSESLLSSFVALTAGEVRLIGIAPEGQPIPTTPAKPAAPEQIKIAAVKKTGSAKAIKTAPMPMKGSPGYMTKIVQTHCTKGAVMTVDEISTMVARVQKLSEADAELLRKQRIWNQLSSMTENGTLSKVSTGKYKVLIGKKAEKAA